MENAFWNRQRTALVAAVSVMLFTLAGCTSLPKVNPPDPKYLVLDIEGQLRQFKEFTPQQVLEAAEEVLRRHEPEATFVRSADILKMESHRTFFIVIVLDRFEERWAVHAREEDQVTVASVAMDIREASDCPLLGCSATGQFPSKAEWNPFGTIPARKVDYGMFWHRVQSILTGAPWPECVKVSERRVSDPDAVYIDPLCSKERRSFIFK
jgi:hypothetical protein